METGVWTSEQYWVRLSDFSLTDACELKDAWTHDWGEMVVGPGSEMFSCVRVRSAVCFPLWSLADSPHHVIGFSLLFSPCVLEENVDHERPTHMQSEGKGERDGFVSVYSQLPFDLRLLNITSAGVRDRQEAKTMAGKLRNAPLHLHFTSQTLHELQLVLGIVWIGKLGRKEFHWNNWVCP